MLAWLDSRIGYTGIIKMLLDEPIPGGARWWYVFGSVLTFILSIQILTGIFLAAFYSPASNTAWASVAFIQDQLALGWFVRGLHSTGASAMVIMTVLHLAQVLIYGAYRAPREMNWIVGVSMLGLVLAFALTGYLLPWDQKGYWATQVATSIIGTTPLIGPELQKLLQGGSEYGSFTITHFYALHTYVLPGIIIGALLLHLYLFRRHGVTPKWDVSQQELVKKTQPFWPDQLYRDIVACGITFLAIVLIVLRTHGAELEAPADPSSTYVARPEWYFLPLFQILKYFEGPLEIIGTMVLPGHRQRPPDRPALSGSLPQPRPAAAAGGADRGLRGIGQRGHAGGAGLQARFQRSLLHKAARGGLRTGRDRAQAGAAGRPAGGRHRRLSGTMGSTGRARSGLTSATAATP